MLILGLLLLLWTYSGYALIPLTTLLHGPISEQEVQLDPLDYVFNGTRVVQENRQEREILMKYLGHWQEGENLQNRCQSYSETDSLNRPLRDHILRTMMTAYQFIGIDLTTRAIVEYAKALDWPAEQFLRLSQNLVQQYCSPNISIISRQELARHWANQYQYGSGFLLPRVAIHNSFPPTAIEQFGSNQKNLQRELKRTIELFRSFCSWGGNGARPRLLSFMFQDPQFSAFVMRKLAGVEIKYDDSLRSTYLVSSSQGVHVNCQNLICRRTSKEIFLQQFPPIWRGEGLLKGLERTYCQHLRWINPNIKLQNKMIRDWVRQTSQEDHYLMQGQLRALLTGIPEFLLRVDHSRDLVDFLRASYRQSWGHWAQTTSALLAQNLLYEESLNLVKVDSQFYFYKKKTDFRIKLLVALGEFDRVLMGRDKIGVSYHLRVSKDVLRWVRAKSRELSSRFEDLERKEKQIFEVLKRQLAGQVKALEEKFIIRPWEGDLSGIIARELIAQVTRYKGTFFQQSDQAQVIIPIEFSYGPFALRYIHYKRRHRDHL